MNAEQAREFVLALVNRDRAEHGLGSVELDDVASRAAQRHVEDMAAHGFTAHWGTDGSVPEQRYTEAGGSHVAQENAACFFDDVVRELEPDPEFTAEELVAIESAFLNEVPPHDGHRKNILAAHHTHVGVGLAKPRGVAQPCLVQEFVDQYGEYAELPRELNRGAVLEVSGELWEPLQVGAVGLARIALPERHASKQLNATDGYSMPAPHLLFFPEGFRTPKPLEVSGQSFQIEFPVGKQPGRYEVSIWARRSKALSLDVVSLRTLIVR